MDNETPKGQLCCRKHLSLRQKAGSAGLASFSFKWRNTLPMQSPPQSSQGSRSPFPSTQTHTHVLAHATAVASMAPIPEWEVIYFKKWQEHLPLPAVWRKGKNLTATLQHSQLGSSPPLAPEPPASSPWHGGTGLLLCSAFRQFASLSPCRYFCSFSQISAYTDTYTWWLREKHS